MRLNRRRLAATIAFLIAALVLTGCVRADVALTVDGRTDTVSGSIVIAAPLDDDSDASREAAAAVALAIETGAIPSLRDHSMVSAGPYDADGYYGTELTLDAVPIDQLYLGARSETATPVITRQGSDYVVSAVLDTSGIEGVPVAEAEGERPAGAAESQITIAFTFPGEVESVEGSADLAVIDGRTITWSAPWDTHLDMTATASATTGSFPPWIWQAVIWAAIGIGVLAVLGLITVWLRSRHD